jgi:hypothetical protein
VSRVGGSLVRSTLERGASRGRSADLVAVYSYLIRLIHNHEYHPGTV